jgi:hypothetical protein
MSLFEDWCNCEDSTTGTKRFLKCTEKANGRAAIADRLPDVIRSHYDELDRIAADISALGFPGAAAIIAERLPRSLRARSGELGELLATELVEEKLGYSVPVRRLRYKDGREMALRGDDFIGVRINESNELALLKGESKSRAVLGSTTISEARGALSRDNGRPTPTSLLFVADRLMEAGGDQESLGKRIRTEVAVHAIPPSRIAHAMFGLCGNDASASLSTDLKAATADRPQIVAGLQARLQSGLRKSGHLTHYFPLRQSIGYRDAS